MSTTQNLNVRAELVADNQSKPVQSGDISPYRNRVYRKPVQGYDNKSEMSQNLKSTTSYRNQDQAYNKEMNPNMSYRNQTYNKEMNPNMSYRNQDRTYSNKEMNPNMSYRNQDQAYNKEMNPSKSSYKDQPYKDQPYNKGEMNKLFETVGLKSLFQKFINAIRPDTREKYLTELEQKSKAILLKRQRKEQQLIQKDRKAYERQQRKLQKEQQKLQKARELQQRKDQRAQQKLQRALELQQRKDQRKLNAVLRRQKKIDAERRRQDAKLSKLEREQYLRSRLLSDDERLSMMSMLNSDPLSFQQKAEIQQALSAHESEIARRKRQVKRHIRNSRKRQRLNEKYQNIKDIFRIQPNPILLRDQNGARQYRIENTHIKNIRALKDYIMSTVRDLVLENIPTKLNLVVKLILIHVTKTDDAGNPLTKPHHLEHRAKMIPQENWFEPQYDEIWETLLSNFYRITTSQSGWSLRSIDHTDIILSNYEPIGGEGFQVLPKWIGNRGGIINPRSEDGECFKDAIAIAANLEYFEGVKNPQRVTDIHKDLALEFDFTGIGPSPGEKEWKLFEKNNSSVNLKIYYPDPFKKNFITSCHKTPILEGSKRTRRIELFLDTTDEGHYSAIKNKSALLSKQMTGKRQGKCYFCDRCDNVSKSKPARDNHQRKCFGERTRKFEPLGSNGEAPVWKFNNIKGLSIAPFLCYADGECNLQPTHILKGNTKLMQRHIASCWGYYYVGPFGERKYYDFFPENPTENFIQSLICKAKNIFSEFWEPVVRTSLDSLRNRSIVLDDRILKDESIDYSYRYYLKRRQMPAFQKLIGEREKLVATRCYLCDEMFTEEDKKVIDHNHFSGNYLGIAHDACNLQRKTRPEMVVGFHNANYDFVQLLPKFFKDYGVEVEVDGIQKSGEKFMALSLKLKLAKEVHQAKRKKSTSKRKKKIKDFIFTIRFIDTLSFLGASLEKIMESFPESKLIELRREFPNKDDFEIVKRKLPFPYGYMNDNTKLSSPLPNVWECTDALTGERMDDETYEKLESIYNHFKCQNMGDLEKLYLKVDCLLLTDAMQANRQTSIVDSGLDPLNYISLPQLSFDSFLKSTKAELELFHPDNSDMHTLFKNNRRGGFTTCPTRYAEANHKYLKTYDSSKPSIFIMAMDINGMYSSVQEDYLPIRGYEDLDESEFDNWREISDQEGVGLFLVVDLDYPFELHDKHNEFPFLPDHFNGRLDAHLWDRKEIGVRHETLIEAINAGLILKKIHRVIKSVDEKFVKSFIQENNRKRREATTDFEGNVFKLRNNSAYGKFGENMDNRSKVRFAQSEKVFKNYAGKPEFKKATLLDDDVNVVSLDQMTVYEDRPVSIAQAILCKSKNIMTKYWYGLIKKVYGVKAKFLYGDTDSVYMAIETEDFFKDMIPYVDEWYDTSVYASNHPSVEMCDFPVGLNKKKAGLMADDSPKDFITHFYGTASKEHCVRKESGKSVIKAKGIGKRTRDKLIGWEDYHEAIFGKGQNKVVEQRQIRSFSYENFTIKFNKKIFTGDRKRILLDDKINTIANGHWRDIGSCIIPDVIPLPKRGTLGRRCLEVLREAHLRSK